jgi:hypothetical protein
MKFRELLPHDQAYLFHDLQFHLVKWQTSVSPECLAMVRAAELRLLVLGPVWNEVGAAILASAGRNEGQLFLDAAETIIPQRFHGSDGGGFMLNG